MQDGESEGRGGRTLKCGDTGMSEQRRKNFILQFGVRMSQQETLSRGAVEPDQQIFHPRERGGFGDWD